MTSDRHAAKRLGRHAALRSAIIASVVVASTVAGEPWVSPRSAEAQEPTPLRLDLADQVIAFSAGEDLEMTFEVRGDLTATSIVLPPPAPATSQPGTDGTVTTDVTVAADSAQPAELAGPDDPTVPAVPEPPEIAIRVTNYPALADPDDVDGVVGGDVDRSSFGEAIDGVQLDDARSLIEIVDDDTAVLDLRVPTDFGESEADRLQFDEQGVYPVRIEVVSIVGDEATVLATAGTIVQRLPDGGSRVPPLDLALLGAVEEPPADMSDPSFAQSQEAVLDLTAYSADVDSPVTLAFPPRTVASLTTSTELAQDLAQSLADDEFTSLPAAPVNVSSAAQVDRVDTFARQLRAGEDLLTESVPTTPTRRDVWVAREPLSAGGAQVLRDLGTRYLVMTRQMYRETVSDDLPATDLFVEILLPDGGTLPLLVVDDLGARLTEVVADVVTSPTDHAITTIGELLLAPRVDAPAARRSRIVAAPDLGPLAPALVDELDRLTATTPDIRFAEGSTLTGLTDSQLVDGEPLRVNLPATAGPSLEARVQLLDDVGLILFSAGTMLAEDDPRPAEWSGELDGLVSTAYSDAEVDERVEALVAEADRLKTAVEPPEPFTFTLTGRTGEIELPLTNTIDEPVRVVVRLTSPKLEFPDGDVEVVLPPDAETRVVVPVESRANGTSAVEVEVLTPLGEAITEPVRLTSRVTAFTGLGQVLTGGLIVILLAWWFAHWRGRRRAAIDDVSERHPSGAGSIVRP